MMQISKPLQLLSICLLSLAWATVSLAASPMLLSLLEPTPFVPDNTETLGNNPFAETQKDQLFEIVRLLNNDRYAEAKGMIARVQAQYLSRTDEALLSIYKAYIAIHETRFSDALFNTSQVTSPDLLPDNYRVQWHDLRASAFDGLYQHLESVRERIWLEHLLVDAKRLKKNRLLIWQSLLQITPDTLDLLNPDSPPDILSGWISLALLYQNSHGYLEREMAALNRWQNEYPLHPAITFLANLSNHEDNTNSINRAKEPTQQQLKWQFRNASGIQQPQSIAVLLPLQGQDAALSKAIQKGILAAFYANVPQDIALNTQIQFYDTSDLKALPKIYASLRAVNTDFIIGPLRKNAVRQLIEINQANIPMIALNNHDHFQQKDVLFFSLNPEEEAQAVAERLWEQGIEHIALLTIDNTWGERLNKAFLHRWHTLGGRTLAKTNINQGKSLSGNIANLLNVKLSEYRFQQFRRLIPEKVYFEPRIRQDIQAFVLFATPDVAKQIKPLLKFHFAGHLPLFATSHIYSQKNSNPQDDLNGIQYSDIPLIVEPSHQQTQLLTDLSPHLNPNTLRLFALGYDSHQIMLNFSALRSNPGLQLQGMTGILALNDTNHITRQLTWAKFHNGYPKAIKNPYRP